MEWFKLFAPGKGLSLKCFWKRPLAQGTIEGVVSFGENQRFIGLILSSSIWNGEFKRRSTDQDTWISFKTSTPTLAGKDKERYWIFILPIDWSYETYTD